MSGAGATYGSFTLKPTERKEIRRANNGDPYHIDEISGRGRGRL